MEILCGLVTVYLFLFLARMVLSWFPIDRSGPVGTINGFLYTITEPLLGPVRRVLPPMRAGSIGIDLSGIVVLIGIYIVRAIVCG